MNISRLFKDYKGQDVDIKGIKTNSKLVKPGDIFVCTKGANIDRHEFIDDAINNGAALIVTNKDVDIKVPHIKVQDINQALYDLLSNFYDYPQNKVKLIGITGTEGKTTAAKILQELIGDNICGYIGTLGVESRNYNEKTNNTTPELTDIFTYLNNFVNRNIKYVVIECSSESIYYDRLHGLKFDIAGLTNITSDHLNTHKTLENYINCKKQLFINSNLQILNKEDYHFNEVKEVSSNYLTYGINDSDLSLNCFKLHPNSTEIEIDYKQKTYNFTSSLVGVFNINNLMLALLISLNLGFNINDLINKTNNLYVKGRMQSINKGQSFYCLIDYAHTTNAINSVLEFARTLDVNKIITITGQAGGRDTTKRKDIGRIVLEKSDYAIFTEDDPRNEKVEDIIKDMLQATKKTNYEIVLDRKEAIAKAISIAKEKDLLLFLGKGSDTYMAREDRRDYYNEEEEIIQNLK